ncbi:antimicrobial peptide 1-like [Nymphaea colorata]|uniref:antimicrobial peptide 1-like n=1 Tax=Nymphaea colorata TaxID=210225 RepID=UPI00129EB530|nr:antimicrobial peptide 1-like [Nymphaea colorata]
MARSLGLIAALVAMLMVVEFASIADAKYKSYLRVYEEAGCRHRSELYNSCGCHNLKYSGGFKYDYNEKHDKDSKMTVYKHPNCHGVGFVLPHEDKNHCRPFPFKSVHIKC